MDISGIWGGTFRLTRGSLGMVWQPIQHLVCWPFSKRLHEIESSATIQQKMRAWEWPTHLLRLSRWLLTVGDKIAFNERIILNCLALCQKSYKQGPAPPPAESGLWPKWFAWTKGVLYVFFFRMARFGSAQPSIKWLQRQKRYPNFARICFYMAGGFPSALHGFAQLMLNCNHPERSWWFDWNCFQPVYKGFCRLGPSIKRWSSIWADRMRMDKVFLKIFTFCWNISCFEDYAYFWSAI